MDVKKYTPIPFFEHEEINWNAWYECYAQSEEFWNERTRILEQEQSKNRGNWHCNPKYLNLLKQTPHAYAQSQCKETGLLKNVFVYLFPIRLIAEDTTYVVPWKYINTNVQYNVFRKKIFYFNNDEKNNVRIPAHPNIYPEIDVRDIKDAYFELFLRASCISRSTDSKSRYKSDMLVNWNDIVSKHSEDRSECDITEYVDNVVGALSFSYKYGCI